MSKALSQFTLEVVKPRMISFKDQVVAIRQHLADFYKREQNFSEYEPPVPNVEDAANNNDEPQPISDSDDVDVKEEEKEDEKAEASTVCTECGKQFISYKRIYNNVINNLFSSLFYFIKSIIYIYALVIGLLSFFS